MFEYVMTGATCGAACWSAREDKCHCSCGGVNHGIDLKEGQRPERTSKKDGRVYILAAVAPDYTTAYNTAKEIQITEFPDANIWSSYPFKIGVTAIRKVSGSQLKWNEIKTIVPTNKMNPDICLIWKLKAGENYNKRSSI